MCSEEDSFDIHFSEKVLVFPQEIIRINRLLPKPYADTHHHRHTEEWQIR